MIRGEEVRDGTLSLRIEKGNPEWTLALAGEIDAANAATLGAAIERAEAEGGATITVDMRELSFIDSSGIAVLVAAHQRLNQTSERLRLTRSAASGVRRVMEVTGLDRSLPLAASEYPAGTEASG